jgi:GNAT superfamily N-acetyltransferase
MRVALIGHHQMSRSGRDAEMGSMQADLRLGDLDDQAVVQLVSALDEEIRARYHKPVDDFVLKLDPEEVAPGHGAFVVAWADKKAVGCGAVRLIDDETAELKRMYVVPESRRQGMAEAILRFLEDQARALGATRVVLETVTDPSAAVALYRAAGYEEIPKFGPYVESEISFCMGKIFDRS